MIAWAKANKGKAALAIFVALVVIGLMVNFGAK